MENTIFTQSGYLRRLTEQRIPCTVIMTNGFQMRGVYIAGNDAHALAVDTGNVRQMVYKHAISTIRPLRPVCMEPENQSEGEDDD